MVDHLARQNILPISIKRDSTEVDEQKRRFTENLFGLHHGDARQLSKALPDAAIDVTITSPPYFDLKDYGAPNQIGFGQTYAAYLEDLSNVFKEVYRATRNTGSLWIVIDTFRQDHEVLPLPFDLTAKLKPLGWLLRDIIIWKKERTLPWTHKGTLTKKIFEYVLVFSKDGHGFAYNPEKFREVEGLKKWWVKYPERYHPKGKALEEIWEFDIPTQGSWGTQQIRHFCPLPEGLVGRIIDLTTEPGNVVLDPFAGTGTVPAQALFRKRKHIGFELNAGYIDKFQGYIQKEAPKRDQQPTQNGPLDAERFFKLILNLRTVKFARLLYRAASKATNDRNLRIFVRRLKSKPSLSHKIFSAEFVLLAEDASPSKLRKLEKVIQQTISIPPLSKFGIQESILLVSKKTKLSTTWTKATLFGYGSTNSHKHKKKGNLKSLLSSNLPVLSTIGVNVEEPDG